MFIPLRLPAIVLIFCCIFASITPSQADTPRPFDERATARLLMAAFAKADPSLDMAIGSGVASLTVRLANGKAYHPRLDILHAQLRAEADGSRREKLLAAYVAKEMATMGAFAKGSRKTVRETLAAFDPDSVIPILRRSDPGAPWQVPSQVHLPFADDVFVFWLQDRTVKTADFTLTPGPISAHTARALNLDKLKLQKLGIRNLEARLDGVVSQRDGQFVTLSLDGRFGSSLMVMAGYWQQMAAGGQVLTAAIPRQDELIFIANAKVDDLAALRRKVEAERADGGNDLLSPDLFRWTESGWQILPN